ncbi:MAG: electron transfer flavoprotein subunit beta/FixA family protein [Deinococcales bacterium]
MKIVTILKQVPDAEARVRTSEGSVDLDGIAFVIDGMDEYGVEEALRIREGGVDAEIVAVALGPQRFEEALRTALAMGADRAVHVETDVALDAVAQAGVLARLVQEEGADLILLGGKEADWDSAALGAAVAEALGWPLSDWTTELTLEDGALRARHDTDDGSERLEMPLPAVVTTQQGLNEPRYPTLPNIMKAKRKELAKRSLDELGAPQPKSVTLRQEIQTRERLGNIVEGDGGDAARELVRLLADEAKVLP